MNCKRCGKKIEWDTEHDPHAYRHVESVSRWCEDLNGMATPPTNPELWA